MRKRKAQVVIFYLDEDNRKHFLLLKTNAKRGEFWQNVTGSIDEGETYDDGALREAIEETGLSKKDIIKFSNTELCYRFHDRWDRKVNEKAYLIQVKNKFDVTIDPSEHCDYKWVLGDKIKAQDYRFICNYLTMIYARETKC